MSYKCCTLNIFIITTIGFDNTSELILQLGTPVMHDLFRYIVPCWNQGGFQGSNIAMRFCTSLALKDGLHWKVHDVKIRAGWGPHWFVPKCWKFFETPGLNNIGIVCWSNILGEHIWGIRILRLKPWKHFILQKCQMHIISMLCDVYKLKKRWPCCL